MSPSSRPDLTLVVLLLALVLLASPLQGQWAATGLWYLPYLLWAVVIALIAWLQAGKGSGEL